MANLTIAMQNYLEAIFDLSKKSDGVRLSDVAAKLSVSKASVNNATNVLTKLGYITNEKYQEIYLTDMGKETASILEARHSILKTLFTEIVGIPEEVADADACAVEHIISHESIQKIHNFLKKSKVKIKENDAMKKGKKL